MSFKKVLPAQIETNCLYSFTRGRFEVSVSFVHDDDPASMAEFDAEARAAYDRGEWFLAGVKVSVSIAGIWLAEEALWGVALDPAGDGYAAEVADDLADDAIAEAEEVLRVLCSECQQITEGA